MREYPERLSVKDRIELLREGLDASPANAGLLYELSATLAEVGENAESARVFESACRADSNPALNSLIGRFSEVTAAVAIPIRDRARALLEHGVAVSPVMAALAIAQGLLQNEPGVRWLIDYERFFVKTETSSDGLAELAEEIRSDLTFYDQPSQRAIRKGWRHDSLNRCNSPAITAMFGRFREHVDRYIRSLNLNEDHPFPASAPENYALQAWAVVSDGNSYHESHIHQEAWISGVYYVVRPPISAERDTHRGWLHVGPPQWLGSLPGWDERLIEPEPGTLVLMPAYFFHHTMPMGVDQERICVAFDVVPADRAGAENPKYL